MARKSFLATVVGITALAVPNAFADKGGIPHDGSNGQGRSAAQQQQQKAAAAPQGKALAKGHAKSHSNAKANSHHSNVTANSHANANAQAESHGKSEAAKPSTQSPQGPPASNTHAKAGKTTICHATGSATNPFVTITISNNALPAHMRHQDGRDIIPAPAGGCPTGQQTQTEQPPGTTTEQTPPPTTTETQTPAPATSETTAPATQQPAAQVLGQTVTGSSPSKSGPTSTPAGGVLGATTSGSSPSASASPAATGTRASSSSSLPFTGTDAIIVAILGLAALLLGVTMRRAATHKA
jgi:hypothetical protein